jgi:hypothetical protein
MAGRSCRGDSRWSALKTLGIGGDWSDEQHATTSA